MTKTSLFDFVASYPDKVNQNRLLVNVRGTNGSGKSTIPLSMLESDPDTFELMYYYEGRERVAATVFPTLKWLALGTYHNKCGGLDGFSNFAQTFETLDYLWDLDFNILMEGVISSTVRGSFLKYFTEANDCHQYNRDIVVFSLLPPLQTCIDRIQDRNGGKPIKTELVEDKYGVVKGNIQHFDVPGKITSIAVDNSKISREETLEWFFNKIGYNNNVTSSKIPATKVVDITPTCKAGQLLLPMQDISKYPWFPYYKEPKGVEIDENNMRFYWYWIAERQNIWYKRTVEKLSAPWTSDPILRDNSFTNTIRDLDRGTIIYIREILSKIDEPCKDLTQRKKEILFNTMIYRLFIRWETWSQIGFITLDGYAEQWAAAKSAVRKIKESGKTVWHSAYYVNDLKSANPNPKTNSDKVENAICLLETAYEKLDDIYDFILTHDMADCLEKFQEIPAIGAFTAYEWACDLALCHRHTKNIIVSWTDDHYTNVGPGNKKGLDFIFRDRGNLSYLECDFYLRATWREWMSYYGTYERFVSQLPAWMNGDINLRVIEHDCCEFQKWANMYYGTGRCKGTFKNRSGNDLDYLIL